MSTIRRTLLSRIRHRIHLSRIPRAIICLASQRWVDEGTGKILRSDWRVPLRVRKERGAKIILTGNLRISSYQEDRNAVVIIMGAESTLHVDGDFTLTQGTKIVLSKGAHLYIGGDLSETGCGTTGNCRIMVKKKLHIGKDFLCSWNVFITDCDWHTPNAGAGQKDTYIGDHVWVTCNCSILKGSKINDNCILSNGTVVHNREFGPDALIVGNPAQAVKKIGQWKR